MVTIEHRSAFLHNQINQPAVLATEFSKVNKELRTLGSSMDLIKELRAKKEEIDGLKSLTSDYLEDKDMREMAADELAEAEEEEEKRLQHLLLKSLLPKDDADERDCVLEELEEASGTISGTGAYEKLKFESSIHRVQHVPVTEKSDHVHTSDVSVAILPQADEVKIIARDLVRM